MGVGSGCEDKLLYCYRIILFAERSVSALSSLESALLTKHYLTRSANNITI